MKTVKVQGGLGNQLFCMAFAHSVAALGGGRAAVDVSAYAADRYGHRFMLAELAARMENLQITRRPLLSHRLTAALMGLAPSSPFVREDDPPADRGALQRLVARGAYFSGYWQHEEYIAEPTKVRDLVARFISGRAGPRSVHDVVIHCRTYKDEIHPERRGVPDSAFFARALAAIEARGGPAADIVLVSDDPALAMSRLGPLAERVKVAGSVGPFEDMATMMAARGLILSNSSFSWWGGFCGGAAAVVYPRPEGLFHYPAPARRFLVV